WTAGADVPSAARFAGYRARATPGSGLGVRRKAQRHAVDAIAQPGRRRAVVEDMPEMTAATPAMHLGARQQQHVVGTPPQRVRERPVKARPAGAAVIFRLRREQGQRAGSARKGALALFAVE